MIKTITKEEILHVQKQWGDSIVQIGEAYSTQKDYKKLAENHVTKFYGYHEGTVLFKPTKASRKQFRNTFESALSYFIGNNIEFPNDKGFALNPWINVRFNNSGFILNKNYAVSMGNYFFTNTEGKETKVEFTLGFFRTEEGMLKINLHHSSLPYSSK